ncbi:MAG: pectate lyase [Bacteroidota bacterium]
MAVSLPAFPGAQGWAKSTPGGRGGLIIKVTTLAARAVLPDVSFLDAVDIHNCIDPLSPPPQPHIIVFEVGGVIDLNCQTINIIKPYLTIAGQTAPFPGVTFIKGGISIKTHDVIIQHIRIRPGQAGRPKRSGWEVDGISTFKGAHDVIIDHCSVTWATDENLSASGPRFDGLGAAQWRQNTSYRITFSNNIIAEGLSNSSHSKGEHSTGTLIHDNVTQLLIFRNLYVHNMERNPLIKGGAQCVVANNYIYNPGRRSLHYNLLSEEWGSHPYETGIVVYVGNVLRAGHSTSSDLAELMFGGSGDLRYYTRDNISMDRLGNPLQKIGRCTASQPRIIQPSFNPLWPEGLPVLHAIELQDPLLKDVGARPWDRDASNIRRDGNDNRIIFNVLEGHGNIIDSEDEVGGYPVYAPTYQAFNPAAWDLNFMTPV